MVLAIQAVLGALAAAFAGRWLMAWRREPAAGRAITPVGLGLGALTNFFDTLGIGSFAPTTAAIKFGALAADERIPGTLNVGHCLPIVTQALIYITIIEVDVTLLLACVAAAVLGAWFGARLVARAPVRAVRLGMGLALLIAATLFTLANLKLFPAGGEATSLSGAPFAIAVAVHVILGALMSLGVGLYAPSLVLLSLLGLNPRAAFPIMMSACAFLMPFAAERFLKEGKVAMGLALALTLGGVPAVLAAAYIVKELPLEALRWGVVVIVGVAAVMILRDGLAPKPRSAPAPAPS